MKPATKNSIRVLMENLDGLSYCSATPTAIPTPLLHRIDVPLTHAAKSTAGRGVVTTRNFFEDLIKSARDLANKIVNVLKPIINDIKNIIGDINKLVEDLTKLVKDMKTFGKTLKMFADSSPRAAGYAVRSAVDTYNRTGSGWQAYDAAANSAIANGGLGAWLSSENNHNNPIAVAMTGPAGATRSWGSVQRYSRPCVDGAGNAYVASRTFMNNNWATRLIPLY